MQQQKTEQDGAELGQDQYELELVELPIQSSPTFQENCE